MMEDYSFDSIICNSDIFKQTINTIKKYTATDANILLTGSTGVGKSFLSKVIHYNSSRRDKPFYKVNCANLSKNLLESELFGHEKGAFTDAVKLKKGIFELADKGTIFLDEIGEISNDIQTKLLRVIEDKAFERVGSYNVIDVDIRIIAATNKDLYEQIQKGIFREDLYYRLNVLPIKIPDLCDRCECILDLSSAILHQLSEKYDKKIVDFDLNAKSKLRNHSWPGNIRELINIIERAVILSESDVISDTSLDINKKYIYTSNTQLSFIDENEKTLIIEALNKNDWVQKDAARDLGITPRSMCYKVEKFNITHKKWRKNI